MPVVVWEFAVGSAREVPDLGRAAHATAALFAMYEVIILQTSEVLPDRYGRDTQAIGQIGGRHGTVDLDGLQQLVAAAAFLAGRLHEFGSGDSGSSTSI